MKKKIIILAAVAVSGLAAVVASNTNNAMANDCIFPFIEYKRGGMECCVDNHREKCCIYLNGKSTIVMQCENKWYPN